MKKTTKGASFWAALLSLDLIYFVTAFAAPSALPVVGPAIILAITAAGGLYQAANTADNALKGKFYRPELDKEGK